MSCESLEKLRLQLQETDEAIVRLLNERASLALRIGEVKHSLGAQVYDPAQEAKVLERLGDFNQGPMPLKALKEIFREILSCCRAIQQPLKVAFLGPEGSFSHGAALRGFGRSASFIPCPTILEVFRAAEKGLAHCAIVPVENSLEGSVKASLDGLVSTPLKVRGGAPGKGVPLSSFQGLWPGSGQAGLFPSPGAGPMSGLAQEKPSWKGIGGSLQHL